jgi:hypothetical protein
MEGWGEEEEQEEEMEEKVAGDVIGNARRRNVQRNASHRIASQQLVEQATHIETSRIFQTASKSSTLTCFHLFSYQSIHTTTTQRIPT